jgi:hypothetical protein
MPKEGRWSHLQANAKQPSIGKTVDDAMVAIERDSPRLKGACGSPGGTDVQSLAAAGLFDCVLRATVFDQGEGPCGYTLS